MCDVRKLATATQALMEMKEAIEEEDWSTFLEILQDQNSLVNNVIETDAFLRRKFKALLIEGLDKFITEGGVQDDFRCLC